MATSLQGVAGNEKADEWAKQAADELDSGFTGRWEDGGERRARNRSNDQQAAGGEVLPAEDRPLFRWPIPQADEEQTHSQVLVVPLQDTDTGQELPAVEAPSKVLWQ